MKQAYCAKQAAIAAGKDLIGFDIADWLVGKFDSFVDAHSGPVISPNAPNPFSAASSASASPPSFPLLSPVATTVTVLQWGADQVQTDSGAQQLIRQALRDEGWKISTKAVSRGASRFGKFLGAFGALLTANTAWNTYNACMSN